MFSPVAQLQRVASGRAKAAALVVIWLIAGVGTLPAGAFNETGGSGLIRTEQAYSLPIARPLFSFYAGMYSNDFTPGTSRLITLTPSATLGLANGFEGSTALSIEGLTSSLTDEPFTRRIDVRRRALLTKVRWTTDIGSPRLRGGILGHLTLPMGVDQRPGATLSPTHDRDAGLMGLLSTNVGWFDVPVRVHLNVGYWWSRDDGAFIYRGVPTAIEVPGTLADQNDVLEYTLAVEAGLRRALVFLELTSEQFVQARGSLSGSENLWQITPGFRTQLTSTVGLTGGITLNVSSDDHGTAFNPNRNFPDYEFKVGVTLGSVLSREHHEEARRKKASPAPVAVAAAPIDQGSWILPAAPEVAATEPAPAPAISSGDAQRIRDLEDRLARIETNQRLATLEGRLASLEGRSIPAEAGPVVAPGAAAEPAPVEASPTAPVAVAPVVVAPVTVAPAAVVDTIPAALIAAPDKMPPASVTTSLAAPATQAASTVSPEIQAQLDRLQGNIQLLLDQQEAARTASALAASQSAAKAAEAKPVRPTAKPAAPDPGRATVVIGDRGGAPQPVINMAAPAGQPAYRSTAGAGSVLDPALREPYQPAALPEPTKAPERAAITAPAPSPVPTAAAAIEAVEPPALGLEIGQRRTLTGIDTTAPAPLASPTAMADLEELAADLMARPEAGIALLVHGGNADRKAALAESELLAELAFDYLVSAGAPQGSVVPIGMGHSEDSTPRVEIERIR